MGANNSDVELADGRKITFDFERVTVGKYRDLIRGKLSDDDEFELVSDVAGGAIKADEIESLPLPEYRRLMAAFYKKAREPLADPN